MFDIIIVDLNNFALEKPIVVFKDGVKSEFHAEVEKLPNMVAKFAAQMDINKVHIYGAKLFSAPIADGIISYAKLNYNIQNLEVEVITR